MRAMTLPSRHRIRNSNPEGLRPSTSRSWRLPTIVSFRSDGEETFLFLSNHRDRETNSGVKGSGANPKHRPKKYDIKITPSLKGVFLKDL